MSEKSESEIFAPHVLLDRCYSLLFLDKDLQYRWSTTIACVLINFCTPVISAQKCSETRTLICGSDRIQYAVVTASSERNIGRVEAFSKSIFYSLKLHVWSLSSKLIFYWNECVIRDPRAPGCMLAWRITNKTSRSKLRVTRMDAEPTLGSVELEAGRAEERFPDAPN